MAWQLRAWRRIFVAVSLFFPITLDVYYSSPSKLRLFTANLYAWRGFESEVFLSNGTEAAAASFSGASAKTPQGVATHLRRTPTLPSTEDEQRGKSLICRQWPVMTRYVR